MLMTPLSACVTRSNEGFSRIDPFEPNPLIEQTMSCGFGAFRRPELEEGLLAHRSFRAESADRADDELRLERFQTLVAQTEAIHDTRTEVLEHHIALHGELEENLAPFFRARVECDAALVAIDREKVMALAVDERRYGARLIAAADLFDLDHFGAEIGQDQRAERACEHARQVQNAHAVERPAAFMRRLLRRCHAAPICGTASILTPMC